VQVRLKTLVPTLAGSVTLANVANLALSVGGRQRQPDALGGARESTAVGQGGEPCLKLLCRGKSEAKADGSGLREKRENAVGDHPRIKKLGTVQNLVDQLAIPGALVHRLRQQQWGALRPVE